MNEFQKQLLLACNEQIIAGGAIADAIKQLNEDDSRDTRSNALGHLGEARKNLNAAQSRISDITEQLAKSLQV
jgi:hypothetical protein